MGKFHIRLVGGWCGNRMVIVKEHLAQLLADQGYQVKIDMQSIWDNYAPPQHVDLVLQLMPAFKPEELDPPSLLVREFVRDYDHPETLKRILEAVKTHYFEEDDPAQMG